MPLYSYTRLADKHACTWKNKLIVSFPCVNVNSPRLTQSWSLVSHPRVTLVKEFNYPCRCFRELSKQSCVCNFVKFCLPNIPIISSWSFQGMHVLWPSWRSLYLDPALFPREFLLARCPMIREVQHQRVSMLVKYPHHLFRPSWIFLNIN